MTETEISCMFIDVLVHGKNVVRLVNNIYSKLLTNALKSLIKMSILLYGIHWFKFVSKNLINLKFDKRYIKIMNTNNINES